MYSRTLPPRAGYAEKQGGGTSFLFGRKTWKNRWFIIDDAEGTVGYWESEEHYASNSPALKPLLSLKGASVDIPDGDKNTFPFSIKFVGGDKQALNMRTGEQPRALNADHSRPQHTRAYARTSPIPATLRS